jgi:uncharacterized protein YciI
MRLAVLSYSYVPDVVARREPHRAGHLALIESERSAGRLLLAGAVGDPPHGALFVFPDAGVAAAFEAADPYGRAGLVTEARIEPWNVVAHGPLPEGD